MANIRLIEKRIKSAKNISQITKAMELVAASKMKKAQDEALAGKLYANKIYEMVMRLSTLVESAEHPLLRRSESITGKELVVFISTNKGLCGGLNTNLYRFFNREYKTFDTKDFVTVGRKGADFLVRMGQELLADFSDSSSNINKVPALTEYITGKYLDGLYDKVEVIYNDFVSALNQVPRKKIILPLTIYSVESKGDTDLSSLPRDIVIEPSVKEVFSRLLPHYLENQIRDALLEAEASEHSARMIAMRNATDNAKNLTEELTLVYNKARQEKITYEITDMITAKSASEAKG